MEEDIDYDLKMAEMTQVKKVKTLIDNTLMTVGCPQEIGGYYQFLIKQQKKGWNIRLRNLNNFWKK